MHAGTGERAPTRSWFTQGLTHARWQVDRCISRSQRTLAPTGFETFQQDVRVRGDSYVRSRDYPVLGCPRSVEPLPAPQNGHRGASTGMGGSQKLASY